MSKCGDHQVKQQKRILDYYNDTKSMDPFKNFMLNNQNNDMIYCILKKI